MAGNAGLQLIGVWSYHLRALSACCGSCLNCVVFAAIITTGVFRFNNMGSLAALSLSPSKYEDRAFYYDSTSTYGLILIPSVDFGFSNISDLSSTDPFGEVRQYQDDATAIVWLWTLMMMLCCFNCCTMGYASKPPTVDGASANTNYD